jgi:AcrR family transcriptional regulator
MVITSVGRRQRAKVACRTRIIHAGIRLFGERGLDAVTVDDIAAAADVGKGTIYNYFRTKEDIVVAFMADIERTVNAALRDLDAATRPLAETLVEFMRLQFQMKAPYHRFVRVFFAQMFLHTDRFLPQMAEMHQMTRATIQTVLVALQRRRAIRADVSIEDLTLVFGNMQLGLTALWAVEGPPFQTTHHVLEREVALFCEGIETRKR